MFYGRISDGLIPGLFVFPDYFSKQQCKGMTKETIDLYSRLEKAAESQEFQKANIPQPDFVLSEKHNLVSEEYYLRLKLAGGESSKKLRCEYFPRYGEDGHALAYFRGNRNLPDFVADGLLTQIEESMQEIALLESESRLTWKLTVNYYKNVAGTVAGFPFHVDIPANGIVTMIMNVQKEALFQITNGDEVHDIKLPIGALLVLSGESRYEWKHRVLPSENNGSENEIKRVSLVLGFQ